MEERTCDNCGRWIEGNEQLYVMSVTLSADPGPVQIDDKTSIGDVRDEFERLILAMERMSREQVEEATDQVHESYRFILCPECRREVHHRMKRRVNIVDPG
jgi:NMD protein affecting ribosome stability and mRNA decay